MAMTDASGVLVLRTNYAPYGSDAVAEGTVTEKYRFGDKEKDGTGLYFYGARYYDPEIGRFISVDPAEDGDNWYAFCNDNPVKYVDPDGEKVISSSTTTNKIYGTGSLSKQIAAVEKTTHTIEKINEVYISKTIVETKISQNAAGRQYANDRNTVVERIQTGANFIGTLMGGYLAKSAPLLEKVIGLMIMGIEGTNAVTTKGEPTFEPGDTIIDKTTIISDGSGSRPSVEQEQTIIDEDGDVKSDVEDEVN